MTDKTKNILFKTPALVWGFLLFYFTLLPSEELPKDLADLNDKMLHALIFFIWTSLIIVGLLRYPIKKTLSPRLLKSLCFIVITAGGLIEVLQYTLVPGRSGDWWDFLANSVGTVIAALLWSILIGRRAWLVKKNKI